VTDSYQRYLQNGFRAAWGFEGVPLRINLRRRGEDEEHEG
jgi:predicted GTPase